MPYSTSTPPIFLLNPLPSDMRRSELCVLVLSRKKARSLTFDGPLVNANLKSPVIRPSMFRWSLKVSYNIKFCCTLPKQLSFSQVKPEFVNVHGYEKTVLREEDEESNFEIAGDRAKF
ncbi:hypothetical protein KSP40_PGU003542 [Platanthera guangdongensis]|uniref:Uncharacterized protein n=1 Tax=Platanthera guangdongensis TaxID=2320717 RepID=A0ABR2LDB0_9ASPA